MQLKDSDKSIKSSTTNLVDSISDLLADYNDVNFKSFSKKNEGFVYLIKAEGSTRYKIGRTVNIDNRMSELKKQSPFPLHLENYFWSYDNVLDEKLLHLTFSYSRVHGEWFEYLNGDDQQSIYESEEYQNRLTPYSNLLFSPQHFRSHVAGAMTSSLIFKHLKCLGLFSEDDLDLFLNDCSLDINMFIGSGNDVISKAGVFWQSCNEIASICKDKNSFSNVLKYINKDMEFITQHALSVYEITLKNHLTEYANAFAHISEFHKFMQSNSN